MADSGIAAHPRCTFGPYVLDTANRRLTRDGKAVPVTARVFDILIALVQEPGQPLDKDTLIARVWGDTAVEEGNLARSVSTLRKVLGESPEDHRYIVTLPGRGYQFVAPVRIVDDGVIDTKSSSVAETVDRGERAARRSVARRAVTVAVAAAALAAVAIATPLILTRSVGPSLSTPPRIVVLPFTNMGPNTDEYVAAGITEEITNQLTAVQTLRVVSRTTASRYGRSGKTAREIGAELGADYLLEGSVLWNRPPTRVEQVRIAAQLIRAADDTHVWAETFDRDVENLFAVQSEIAIRVVRELRSMVLASEQRALESVPTRNSQAYRAYLQGLFYTSRPDFSATNMARAIQYFEEAARLDPSFAQAHGALARAHVAYFSLGYDTSRERRELARRSLGRAERLGPTLPVTLQAKSAYWQTLERDSAKALATAEDAERRWPNDAGVVMATANILERTGRWGEAAEQYARARDLDPHNPFVHTYLGSVLLGLRRYPEVQHAIERSLALEPDQQVAYILRVWNTWMWKGDLAAARALIDRLPRVPDWRFMELEFLQCLYERRFNAAIDLLKPWTGTWMRTYILARPVVLFEAQAARLAGHERRARAAFELARAVVEAEVLTTPDDGRLRTALGLAYAGLGRREDALREARSALERMPNPTGFDTSVVREDVALIATMVGEHDFALREIATLLSTPAHFSVQLLKLDPRWDPLRSESRYKELTRR